ncbi:MAG: T9SS type A sorting domain-containing protein [Bacteroidetes bacterium]|nr:T9SS type A sorting domain-containing protein [Bacteroidota bacterium]
MNKFLLLFTLLYFTNAHAQQNNFINSNSQSFFNAGKLNSANTEGDWVNSSMDFAVANHPDFKDKRSALKLIFQNQSILGFHYDFIQTFNGVEVFGTDVKLNIAKSGGVLSLFCKTVNTTSWGEIKFNNSPQKNVVWVDENLDGIAAYEVKINKENKSGKLLQILDENNKTLYSKDLSLYYGKAKDSTVTAAVFLPDPLTTAHKDYGIPYIDYSDSAVPELDAERKLMKMVVSYEKSKTTGADSFYLESKYFKMKNLEAPNDLPPTPTSPYFIFSRHESGFEFTNVFFHLTEFRKQMAKLGFANLDTTQMLIDAQGGYQDQSHFDTPNLLYYETGGVDDGEDADVIIHEYNHSVSEEANGGTVFGVQRTVIEEGLCDYFACSYSKNLNSFHWDQLFNWDGHNPFWGGRSCVTKKSYNKNRTWSVHGDADLWAGTIMEIYDTLGRDTTDLLMFATLHSLAKYQDMDAAAKLFMQADSILFNYKHKLMIARPFIRHKFLPETVGIDTAKTQTGLAILSRYFAKDGFLYIKLSKPESGSIILYDMQGKEVANQRFSASETINIYKPELSSGVYLLRVVSSNLQYSCKLQKYK